MIINLPSSDFDELLTKISELIGKPVFQSYLTFGSMFMFDLGERTEKYSFGRLELIGENTVIVENADWSLSKDLVDIASSRWDQKANRKCLPQIINSTITSINFDDQTKKLSFNFTLGYKLDVVLSETNHRDIGIKLSNSNWIDIGPGQTWVEVTSDHVG